MKIGIIGIESLIYMPYLDKYASVLKTHGLDYEVIYWNRLLEPTEKTEANMFSFNHYMVNSTKKIYKMWHFYQYRKFLMDVLKDKEYDKLIILCSLTGMLLNDYLKKYKNRYIFDIRDYTYEKYAIYYSFIKRIINNSYRTSISSEGFKKFLPESDKYILSHNVLPGELHKEMLYKANGLPGKNKYIISFIGMIRFLNENIKLINKLANSNNLDLYYIGKGNCEDELERHCKENNINNVYFFGKYQPEEKPGFYINTDFVNNLFGNDSLEVSTLISNRLYDTCIYKKPILVSDQTFMAELVNKYQVGLSINMDNDNMEQKILKYIRSFDRHRYDKNCKRFLEDVKLHENVFEKELLQFVNT